MSPKHLHTRRCGFTTSRWRKRLSKSRSADPRAHVLRPSNLSSGLLTSDLPYLQRFMQHSPTCMQLLAEAQCGSRACAIRIIFEGIDTALQTVAEEAMLPPRDPRWHGTRNRLILPEEKADFTAQLESQCRMMALLGEARQLRVRPPDSGFFAAFLTVLDCLLTAHPASALVVDWTCTGHEQHFTYAPDVHETCVWGQIFEPIHQPATCQPLHPRRGDDDGGGGGGGGEGRSEGGSESEWVVASRCNFFLTGRFRWRLRGSPFAASQRATYHQIYKRWVHLRHPQLLEEVATLGAQLAASVSLGIHKRVDTPGTAAYQGTKSVPSVVDYMRAVRMVMSRLQSTVDHIYLATDCALAEAQFREAFGEKLITRAGVRRTPGGVNADHTLNEAHIRSPHNPSPAGLEGALQVLGDALMLSHCGHVLHMDSNVSSAVAIINPNTEMLHVADVLAGKVGI